MRGRGNLLVMEEKWWKENGGSHCSHHPFTWVNGGEYSEDTPLAGQAYTVTSLSPGISTHDQYAWLAQVRLVRLYILISSDIENCHLAEIYRSLNDILTDEHRMALSHAPGTAESNSGDWNI